MNDKKQNQDIDGNRLTPNSPAGGRPKPTHRKRYNRSRRPNKQQSSDATNKENGGSGDKRKNNDNHRVNNRRGNSPPYKKKRPQNNRRRYNNRPSSQDPIPTGFEGVLYKYQKLFANYLLTRKKYFSFFFRTTARQKEKLEFLFSKSVQDLRRFEDHLKPEDKEKFKSWRLARSKVDDAYSRAHNLMPEGTIELAEQEQKKPLSPHFLPSQEGPSFQEDSEESQGTYEDYKIYKGL